MPKKIIPKLKKILPVKGVKQDVEADDDDTKEFLKYCISQSEHGNKCYAKIKIESQRLKKNIKLIINSQSHQCVKLQIYIDQKISYRQRMK